MHPPAQTVQSAQWCAGKGAGACPGSELAGATPHNATGGAPSGIAAADTAVGSNPSISKAAIASQAATR